jgi:Spy/CpxP family protein refolding chaperone
MRKRTVKLGLGVLLFALSATFVEAQPPPTVWGNWPGVMANPLGLSSEQMNQIQEILVQWQEGLLPLWTDLQKKHWELAQLLRSLSPDPTAVEAKSKEIGSLQAELQRKSLEKRNAIREVLNEEQKAFYDWSGLGYGWGRGPCGLGLGLAWGGGIGWGRGWGFGRGGVGFGWAPGFGRGFGMTGWGFFGPGWGRGPCGMGLGGVQMSPWLGSWPWWGVQQKDKEPQK